MTISHTARVRARARAEALRAEQKRRYVERIDAIKRAVSPMLSNTELAEALELDAPAASGGGASAVGRFVSEKPRHKSTIPDRFTRALIDEVYEGALLLAVEERIVPGTRRAALICGDAEAERLGHDWNVVNVAGGPVPERVVPDATLDWEDDAIWTGGAVERRRSVRARDAGTAPKAAGRSRARSQLPPDAASVGRSRVEGARQLGERGPAVSPIGLGCMRLSTDGRPWTRDAVELMHTALERGIRFFDTADVYALGEDDIGHNERLIAGALETASTTTDDVVVATKGGLVRRGKRWLPNGRPEHLIEACEASLDALGLERLDLYQLHAVDSRVPLDESVGALFELRDRGLVARVGVCNVTRAQLEALLVEYPEVATVQHMLNPFDKRAFSDGLVDLCLERGIGLIAYNPLGGHRKRDRVQGHAVFSEQAVRLGVTPQELALAWLLDLAPTIVPIPGATRRESVVSSARATKILLDETAREALDAAFPVGGETRSAARDLWSDVRGAADTAVAVATDEREEEIAPRDDGEADVVLIMGSPAAGKSSLVAPFVNAGYVRLNRDLAGGTLAQLVPKLEERAEAGVRRFVLDNTYPTRASRRPVIAAAARLGLPVRALHLTTSVEDAQINAATRMLAKHERLLAPDEIRALGRKDPNTFPPVVLFRHQQIFEQPTHDEGLAAVEDRAFVRRRDPDRYDQKALLLDIDGTIRRTHSGAPYPMSPDDIEILPGRRAVLEAYASHGYHLLGVSNQSGIASERVSPAVAEACFERTVDALGIEVDIAWCPHASGRVKCFCRKPMPGLGVLHIERYGLDVDACIMVGDMDSDAAFAETLGIDYVPAETFFSETYEHEFASD